MADAAPKLFLPIKTYTRTGKARLSLNVNPMSVEYLYETRLSVEGRDESLYFLKFQSGEQTWCDAGSALSLLALLA